MPEACGLSEDRHRHGRSSCRARCHGAGSLRRPPRTRPIANEGVADLRGHGLTHALVTTSLRDARPVRVTEHVQRPHGGALGGPHLTTRQCRLRSGGRHREVAQRQSLTPHPVLTRHRAQHPQVHDPRSARNDRIGRNAELADAPGDKPARKSRSPNLKQVSTLLDEAGKPEHRFGAYAVLAIPPAQHRSSGAPRELRHTPVPLMSDHDIHTKKISVLVGHSCTENTETVYHHQPKLEIRGGAECMNDVFSRRIKAA